MAGEIPKLLAEYAKKLAPTIRDFSLGKPTDKSKLYTALDKLDPLKLVQNANPDITAKAAMLETYMLPVEKTDQIIQFIYNLNTEADQIIKTLNEINIEYITEFKHIISEITSIVEAITRNIITLIFMIIWFTLLFTLQIVFLVVVDIFWTELNLLLMVIWIKYAMLFFIPDVILKPDMRAPENGAMILAILMPAQIAILIAYLFYIFIQIDWYVANFSASILLLAIHSETIIAKHVAEIPILFARAMEQISGSAGIIPLIISVEESKITGTSILASQLINPLTV